MEAGYAASLGAVFTLFFVTLGPLKILGPFAQRTAALDPATTRRIALLAFVIGVLAVVLGGFIGRALLESWGVSIPSMLIGGGIIFFLVGLRLVLEQYEPQHESQPALPAKPFAAAMQLTFPTVVTPYGIAALIVLLAGSNDTTRTLGILAVVIGVMVINLLAMLFARQVMGGVIAVGLKLLGAVLGVLQVALAIEMFIRGLRELGVLDA